MLRLWFCTTYVIRVLFAQNGVKFCQCNLIQVGCLNGKETAGNVDQHLIHPVMSREEDFKWGEKKTKHNLMFYILEEVFIRKTIQEILLDI